MPKLDFFTDLLKVKLLRNFFYYDCVCEQAMIKKQHRYIHLA